MNMRYEQMRDKVVEMVGWMDGCAQTFINVEKLKVFLINHSCFVTKAGFERSLVNLPFIGRRVIKWRAVQVRLTAGFFTFPGGGSEGIGGVVTEATSLFRGTFVLFFPTGMGAASSMLSNHSDFSVN